MTCPIRVADERDLPAILEINRSAWPHVAPLDPPELGRLRALGATIEVAAQGTPCGYLIAFTGESSYEAEEYRALRLRLEEPFLYIDQIAIATGKRHRGIGRALLARAEALAAAASATLLCCEVNLLPPNPDSLRFHRALGFDALDELALADGRRVLLLTRRLDGGLARGGC